MSQTHPLFIARFEGFGADTMRFLAELEENNDRVWFKENKHRYDALVFSPAMEFISEMGPRLEHISPHFLSIPKRVGGSLMRVHRDTRFGHDKRPYKTNIGIQFRHEMGKDVHAPGYYLHIANSGCFFGAGMWHPDSEALLKIRQRIVEKPGAWEKILKANDFNSGYSLGGDSLKRPPRGYSEDTPHIEDIKRKDFIASCSFPVAEAGKSGFPDMAAETFDRAEPLMTFLCAAVGVGF